MEKKLLLLGLLQSMDMHGYELSKLLEHSCASPINLSKANAYRLLGLMEKDGWVTHRTEKSGNRPKKRVYSLTEKGRKIFLDLLRRNLSAFKRPEFPCLVGLDLIGFLPPAESAALLAERLKNLKKHFECLDEIQENVRNTHPSIEYMHRYYSAEISWTDSLIRRLEDNC